MSTPSGPRPTGGRRVRFEEWVSLVSPRVTEGTTAPAFPLLPPLLPPFEDSPTPPSPAWGEREEHPAWVRGLRSAHHLEVQQKHYSTPCHILVAEREEPSASSQAFWLKTPTCPRQQWRLLFLTLVLEPFGSFFPVLNSEKFQMWWKIKQEKMAWKTKETCSSSRWNMILRTEPGL